MTWMSPSLKWLSQCAGELPPVSPSICARARIPCWNSAGKLSSDCGCTPTARNPACVNAMLSAHPGFSSHSSALVTKSTVSRSHLRPLVASPMRMKKCLATGNRYPRTTLPCMSARSICGISGSRRHCWPSYGAVWERLAVGGEQGMRCEPLRRDREIDQALAQLEAGANVLHGRRGICGEEEARVHLMATEVGGEIPCVARTRIPHAVLPYGVDVGAHGGAHRLEVSISIPVETAVEQQVRRALAAGLGQPSGVLG